MKKDRLTPPAATVRGNLRTAVPKKRVLKIQQSFGLSEIFAFCPVFVTDALFCSTAEGPTWQSHLTVR
jgi:hypothetical protein